MDIVSPDFNVDDNFLLKNPVWFGANKKDVLGPSPSNFCPCNSTDPKDWISASNCTTQDVQYNQPSGSDVYNALFCGDGGHMNYFPITYECNVCWNDHSGEDDDYNFRLHRSDNALYTAGWNGFLQAEFDSDETVDNWDDTGTWWNDFHHNKVDQSHEAASEAIDGKFAIVIGEAGIDLEHGCHIELHPIYAMFIHVKDDPNDDHWAFFVRNWGNQGGCGRDQVYYQNNLLEKNIVRVKIPHENASVLSFTSNVKGINDHNDALSVFSDNVKDGLLLTFQLDAPEVNSEIVGDINIKWSNLSTGVHPRSDADNLICQGPGVSSQPLSGLKVSDIGKKIEKLDSESKKLLYRTLNERFRSNKIVKADSIIIRKSTSEIKHLSRKELKQINYSKMRYMAVDTTTSRKKNERAIFIKEFLKNKGIN